VVLAERLSEWNPVHVGVPAGAREVMDGVREFLDAVRHHQLVKGHFRGLLHLAIGRTISRRDGTVISRGVTWRELAEVLKLLRWDRELVREYGLNPDDLPPRDRQRFWYSAIAAARIDSNEARGEADKLVPLVAKLGYVVSQPPA
jgi:hypothetical protein